MPSQDGRFEIAKAIERTTGGRVKVTLAGKTFKTNPANLFKLLLADPRVGINAELLPVFRQNLAKLLPLLKNYFEAWLSGDVKLRIEDLALLVESILSGQGIPLGKVPTKFEDTSIAFGVNPEGEPLLPTQRSSRGAKYSQIRIPGSFESVPAFSRDRSSAAAASDQHPTRSSHRPPGRVSGAAKKGARRPALLWGAGTPGGGRVDRKAAKAGPRKKSQTPRKNAVVSTGFANVVAPETPLKIELPLLAKQNYYFWLQVGDPVKGSIETKERSLPTDKLPEQPLLKVVVFDFDDGLRITPGKEVGKIQLQSDNTAIVVKQPVKSLTISAEPKLINNRLFFPVRTSKQDGTVRLRCNIYYEQVLVQSRLVEALVGVRPKPGKPALSSTVDYTLAHKLSPSHVKAIKPHRLSVMLNDNGNGTHGFRFVGQKEFLHNATFDGQELQDWITQARETLRVAAWGNKNPWQAGTPYLYAGSPDLNQLKGDLIRFAKVGYGFYDSIVEDFTDDVDQFDELAALMKTPGLVQIAHKRSARDILPAAMIYDYGIESNLPSAAYQLCPGFLDAYKGAAPLEDSACFKGECPTRDVKEVVCPSGFWGYRHMLGMPLSVKADSGASSELKWQGKPELTVGVSTDPQFKLRTKHEAAIQALRELTWNYGNNRADVLKLLKEKNSQLVYLFCHGGFADTIPFIQVGPKNETGITRDNIRREKIRWRSPRPLVFINGCHTAALEPDVAIDFISAFVQVAGACGVIGTEITIFEPLAKAFAEECLRRFLKGDLIGDAIRGARLKLLKDGNPLGLVYIPYVMADLRLVESANN